MRCEEDCRTAGLGKTERPVGWEGNGEPARRTLVRHCTRGNPQTTDRCPLPSMGHSFTLDCNIYVRSQRAGQRVMANITRFLAQRLKLKVNEAKSAVARPEARKFRGFSFSNNKEPKRRIAPKALLRCQQEIRELT